MIACQLEDLSSALLETNLEGLPKRQGKVRDVYDLGDRLLLVATDRISAFDWVLPTGIPDKGRVLTASQRLLVRASGRAQPPDLDRRSRTSRAGPRRRRRASRSGAARCWCARRGSCRSSASSAATSRAAAGRSTARRARSAASSCPGTRRERPDRADLHAGHQGRDRATMRTSRSR